MAHGKNAYEEALGIMQLGFMHFKVIVAGGLTFTADAAVTMIVGVLSIWIQCEFNATTFETALMNGLLFLGTLIGCNLQGIMADAYGRRTSLIVFMANLTVGTILFALSPTMPWIFLTRFLLGMFLEPFAITYTVEFFPVHVRRFALLAWLFWSIGTVLAMAMAYVVMTYSNWRTLAILLFIFPLISTRALTLVPESPRYLYINGKRSEAMQVLYELDSRIKSRVDPRRFMEDSTAVETRPSTPVRAIINKTFLVPTLILSLQWYAAGVLYIGITILSVTYIKVLESSLNSMTSFSCSTCVHLEHSYYVMQAVYAIGDGIGVIAVFLMLNRFSGRITLVTSIAMPSIILPWLLLNYNTTVASIIIFVAKIGIGGARAMVLQIAVEVYPTSIRGTALALLSNFLFLGSATAPFLGEVLIYINASSTVLTFVVISVVAAASAYYLPSDTSTKELQDL